MATIYATTNGPQVGAWFTRHAADVSAFTRVAPGILALGVKGAVLPFLVEEAPEGETGDLAQSQDAFISRVPGGADVSFGANTPYADFVLHGTGIYHTPDAHEAWDVDGYQAFMAQGSMVYTMHTHHEGQHADDWPGRAWERSKPAIELALQAIDTRLFAVFL